MWKAVSLGWMPPKLITEEDYYHIRNNKDQDKALTGYVGFALSYGGKWFGGYRRDVAGTKEDKTLKQDNEITQSRRSFNSLLKQSGIFKEVSFLCKSILEIDPENRALLYCDPPYKGTTGYKHKFDYSAFYSWCRSMKSKGHVVVVSEYDMPNDFKCIWSKEIVSSLTKNTGAKKGIEKLFLL